MTFADEIDRQASYRETLVRLTPARYIGAELVFDAGTTYAMSFPYPLARLERNGTALTKVATFSGNDQWIYDETTLTLQVRLASAPHAESNIVVAFYYLFYSSVDTATYEDPEDDATIVRQWQPLLIGAPTFRQALSDIFYGVFTVQNSGFEIQNHDAAFQNNYLTQADSFYNKAVDVWLVVNESVEKIFSGVVNGLSLSEDSVRIDVHDVFEKLGETATMGDDLDETVLLTSAYPNMDTSYNFRPIRYVVGHSRHGLKSGTYLYANHPSNNGRPFRMLDFEMCEEATYTEEPIDPDGANNRGPFALCRTGPGGLKTLTFGSFTNATIFGNGALTDYGEHPRLTFTYSADDHNLEIGDTFTWSHASLNAGGTQEGLVMEVAAGSVSCSVMSRNGTFGSDVNVTAGTFNTNAYPAVMVARAALEASTTGTGYEVFPLVAGVDFTIDVTTLASGNKFYEINFVTDMETRLNYDADSPHGGWGGVFDPQSHKVYFRASTSAASNATRHDEVLATLLEAAGITCDSASFAAAGSSLDTTVSFTIPSLTNTDIMSYSDYVQTLLASTLGYCALNAQDGEVEYTLVDLSISTSDDIDANIILGGPPTIDIEYGDIATELRLSNHHLPAGDTYSFPTAHSVSTNLRAQYLHGVKKSIEVESVLDTDDRAADIMLTRSSRRGTYRFKLATKLLDASIGDDVQLTHVNVLGTSANKDMKITSINKSANDVEIEATDLETY